MHYEWRGVGSEMERKVWWCVFSSPPFVSLSLYLSLFRLPLLTLILYSMLMISRDKMCNLYIDILLNSTTTGATGPYYLGFILWGLIESNYPRLKWKQYQRGTRYEHRAINRAEVIILCPSSTDIHCTGA